MQKNENNFLKKDRVLLVAVLTNNLALDSSYNFNDDLLELENLVNATETMEVVEKVSQNLDEINKHSYVGSGKIEELRMIVDSLEIDTVVCNDELLPSQIETLESALKVKIIDRTYIILEIFRLRAKTKEAKIQVEIARLKYMLPRLNQLRSGFSRQGGGRNKGKGEKQLELDKRQVEDRIAYLNNNLKELTKERSMQRILRKKNNMLIASLVGYTNSGKSSTLNAIVQVDDKQVFEKDMLFATLETTTRLVKTEDNLDFLLTDTVGFINKLPHTLVEAFKSTLEEITESDLIIHVVDASNPNYMKQIEITNKVLEEIGAKDIPMLYAFNKIDKLNYDFLVPYGFAYNFDYSIAYSAKNKDSMKKFLAKVEEMLFINYKDATFEFPYDKGNLVSMINENGKVIKTEYGESITVLCKVSDYLYNYLKQYRK